MVTKIPYAVMAMDMGRYPRQVKLWGEAGQKRLGRSKVLVAGVGGLGSNAALQLARLGVGCLRLVDGDTVSLDNIHRQPLYKPKDTGRLKADVAGREVREMDPRIRVESIASFVDEDNVEGLVKGMDVVVDGFDSFGPRYLLNRACSKKKIPYVFAGVLKSWANLSVFEYSKNRPCLECAFGGLQDELLVSSKDVGIHPAIVGVAGNIEVHQAVDVLLGRSPSLSGRVLYVNLDAMDFELLDLEKDKRCPVCSV